MHTEDVEISNGVKIESLLFQNIGLAIVLSQ